MMSQSPGKIVVVLGMHRSGTSVIARALQVLGVELGERLMPASEGNNPRGFWEDLDIHALNVEMLHFLQRDWHSLSPLYPSDVEALTGNGYLERATALLREKTAAAEVFGFKDPRVAKLLPFWKAAIARGRMDARYVLVVRHPLSVSSSLAKRDRFDPEKSHLLWLEHVIGSLAGTEGETRVLVEYDAFMTAPSTELARIGQALQLPLHAAELERFQQEFLDRQLQHTIYEPGDLLRDEAAPTLLREVYADILGVTAGRVALQDPGLSEKVAQWSLELSDLRPALALIDRLDQRLTTAIEAQQALRREGGLLRQEKAKLAQAFLTKDQELKRMRAEVESVRHSRLWRWGVLLRSFLHRFQRSK